MEFHGEFSMEIHGIPWNSMEVFHTGMQVQVPVNVLEYLTQQIQLPLQYLQPYIE